MSQKKNTKKQTYIQRQRQQMIDLRSKNVEDSREFDKPLKSLLVPDDFKVYEDTNTYVDHHFERTFPTDESQELISHIANIKHLIETQYTFKGTRFYEIYVQTSKLYKHYCSLFLAKKVPNKKINNERIRILTILTGVLYPYYIEKTRTELLDQPKKLELEALSATQEELEALSETQDEVEALSETQEEFIICILYYYFSLAHIQTKYNRRQPDLIHAPEGTYELYRMIKYNVSRQDRYKMNEFFIPKTIRRRLANIELFLLQLEPALSDILMPTAGGKPKTKKNKPRRTRRTRRT
jgi:hypothetical protein